MFSNKRYQDGSGISRHGAGAQKVLVAALLFVHTAWICIHLGLVATEQINPWKLGGYGMYTVPHYNARTHVYIFDQNNRSWVELRRDQHKFNSYLFDNNNYLHVFRCHAPSEAAIVSFFDENPHLRYRPLLIAIGELRFSRYPISVARDAPVRIEIAWGGRTKFGYRGVACGEEFSGEVVYQPPT